MVQWDIILPVQLSVHYQDTQSNVYLITVFVFVLQKPPKKARIDNENIPPSPKTDYGNKEPAPLLKKYDTSPDRDLPSSPGGDMPKTECLSPEQKDRVNGNKAAALAKLREKQTNGLLTKVGDSWYKALQEEFTKPYFVEVKFVFDDES